MAAYPNWTLKQVGQKTDADGKTEGILFQYVSDDPADTIVRFCETATRRQATLSRVSAMYTPDGTMISVMSPDGGVPELDPAGEHIVRTWKSMVTIVRFQAVRQ